MDGLPPDAPRAFVDLHTHSSASFDSLAQPAAMLDKAAGIGLTHLAITDHEKIDGALRARDLHHGRVQVIIGEEIRTREGDLLGLFLEHAIQPGMSAADTAAAIREQGGIVGLPHPFDGWRSSGGSAAASDEGRLERLAAIVDYVESHNARAYRDANPLAAAYAERHGLPAVAASDAHSVMEVGIASTIVAGGFTSAEELRVRLPKAQPLPGRASYYVRLWTPVAKLVNQVRGNGRVSLPATEDGA